MSTPAPERSRTLTVAEAAREAGVSQPTVERWLESGVLVAHRFPGGRGNRDIIRIPRKHFEAFMKATLEGKV